MRLALHHALERDLLEAAREARVVPVELLIRLFPGDHNIFGVCDHHIVAVVKALVRQRLVLAHEQLRRLDRHATEDLALGVNVMPKPRLRQRILHTHDRTCQCHSKKTSAWPGEPSRTRRTRA